MTACRSLTQLHVCTYAAGLETPNFVVENQVRATALTTSSMAGRYSHVLLLHILTFVTHVFNSSTQ
jgi:hypothetical protein